MTDLSRAELVAQLAGYIRTHRILPTVREYQANRGKLPDESTLRARLGRWPALWREALTLALLRSRGDRPPVADAHLIWRTNTGALAADVAAELGWQTQEVHERLRELRDQGVQVRGQRNNVGVGQPKKRTRWPLALAAGWPLTQDEVERWYTDKQVNRASAILHSWVQAGWIARRPDGAYDRIGGPDVPTGERTHWPLALAATWPLTRAEAMGWYTENQSRRASALLATWVKSGWIEKRPDGAYDRVGGPDA